MLCLAHTRLLRKYFLNAWKRKVTSKVRVEEGLEQSRTCVEGWEENGAAHAMALRQESAKCHGRADVVRLVGVRTVGVGFGNKEEVRLEGKKKPDQAGLFKPHYGVRTLSWRPWRATDKFGAGQVQVPSVASESPLWRAGPGHSWLSKICGKNPGACTTVVTWMIAISGVVLTGLGGWMWGDEESERGRS